MTEETTLFQSLMKQGHSAAWEENWPEALEKYRLALNEMPNHPIALASAGLACVQTRQYDEAMRYFLRCTSLTPDDPMPFEKMGYLHEIKGNKIEAVKAFMQAGEQQLKARDVDRAISAFKDAIRLDPSNQTVHMRLAMIYDKMRLTGESIAEYLIVAGLMQSTADVSKALQVVQYALKMDPTHPKALQALEGLKTGRQIGGSATIKQPAPPPPAPAAQEVKAERPLVTEDAPPNYDPVTEARLAALKDLAGLLFDQNGEESSKTNAPRNSLHILSRGTGELNPKGAVNTRINAHLSRTIDLQTAAKDQEAAVELERAIDLGLSMAAADFLCGLLLSSRNPQKSMKYLQKSVRNPAYALAANLLMAEYSEKNKQFKQAAGQYLQALKLADLITVSPQLENELSQFYEPILEAQQRNTDDKSAAGLCQTIRAQLIRPDWRNYLKEARAQLPPQTEGNPPIPLAEMLLETTNGQVIEALAFIKQLAAQGKLRTAMEEAYHTLTYAPSYLPLHIQMGELLILEGRLPEAVAKFIATASLYSARGETNQAIRLLTRVCKLAPMDLSVRAMLIDLLYSAGRNDDAVQQYMEIANIHYQMAELDLAKQNYQQALDLAEKSPSARSWVIKILNKMADIELQTLDLKEAIKYLEQLRTLEPMDATTRATLIDLYLRINLSSSAMNELDAYLKILQSSGQSEKSGRFLDDLLNDRPDNSDIQKRLINFYRSQDQLDEIIQKLDELAEKCLRQENREGALSTLENLIALHPPNANDYRRLYDELKSRHIPPEV